MRSAVFVHLRQGRPFAGYLSDFAVCLILGQALMTALRLG